MSKNLTLLIVLITSIIVMPVSGRDLTFFVWSDTHFGNYDENDTTRLNIIEQMNKLPRTKYPQELFIDTVIKRPAFLLHLGDITDNGYAFEWDSHILADQRSYLQTIKHLTATKRTYETIGNHDSYNNEVSIRNLAVEKNGSTYYSFDEQRVHFIILDAYPHNNTETPWLDENQLTWLKADLDMLKKSTPIIIAMHVHPGILTSADNNSDNTYKTSDQLWDILAGMNVVAFLQGHKHMVFCTEWHEFDVISPAGFAFRLEDDPERNPVFGIVRITNQTLTILAYDWNKQEFLPKPTFVKSFAHSREMKGPKSKSNRRQ